MSNIRDILYTKLQRPPLASDILSRDRLTKLLDQGRRLPLTLISAPAGYGKSTLASRWVVESVYSSGWVTLDESDNDPYLFLIYFLAAFKSIFPQIELCTEAFLKADRLPSVEELARFLLNDLNQAPEPFNLVLDDYQCITEKFVHDLIGTLLKHPAQNMHLILVTRHDPPLPLATFRGRGLVNEIRTADLSFTPSETAEFLNKILKTTVDATSAALLVEKIEGWPVGLRLAGIYLKDSSDLVEHVRRLSGSSQHVADYLLSEVFERQQHDIAAFLIETAILDRFCAPLYEQMQQQETSAAKKSQGIKAQEIIRYLVRDNLFVIALDDQGHWFRYHHLFQNFLKHQLRNKRTAHQIADLHRLAASWFAENDLIEEALRHFLAADDRGAAVRLLGEKMHAAIDNDLSRRTLARWLALFPESSENQHPVLLLAHAHSTMSNWNMSGMAQLLDRAEALLQDPAFFIDPNRRQSLEGDYHALRARHLYWQGDAEGALRHARQALPIVPSEHRYTFSIVFIYYAAAYAMKGQREEGLRLLEKAMSEDCSLDSLNMAALLTARAAIHYYAGDLPAMEQTAEQILAVQKAVPVPEFWQDYAHHFIGSAAYERNLLDSAAEHFGRVAQKRYLVSTRLYQDALLGLGLVAQARGDRDTARGYVESAKVFAVEMNDSYSLKMAGSLQTRLALFSEEDPSVPPENGPTMDSNKFWLEVPSLTRAEYLARKATPSDCSAALQCVEDGLQKAEHHHNTWQAIQFQAVKVLALHCSGRREAALELLEETLRRAEPLGFVRTFIDRGPPMAELLKALSENKPEDPYLHRLLDAFGVERPSGKRTTVSSVAEPRSQAYPAADETLSDGLSNRELDVLILLQERLTNKEIAQKLYVSPETVKTHIAKIYRKLEVNNRRQAVDVARQLKLLPERRRQSDRLKQ